MSFSFFMSVGFADILRHLATIFEKLSDKPLDFFDLKCFTEGKSKERFSRKSFFIFNYFGRKAKKWLLFIISASFSCRNLRQVLATMDETCCNLYVAKYKTIEILYAPTSRNFHSQFLCRDVLGGGEINCGLISHENQA